METEYIDDLGSLESELEDAKARVEELNRKVASATNALRLSRIEKVRRLMAAYDLTIEDIKPTRSTEKKTRAGGGKVPPKYVGQNPGEAWSGRGTAPKWLEAYEANGGRREDLLATRLKS